MREGRCPKTPRSAPAAAVAVFAGIPRWVPGGCLATMWAAFLSPVHCLVSPVHSLQTPKGLSNVHKNSQRPDWQTFSNASLGERSLTTLVEASPHGPRGDESLLRGAAIGGLPGSWGYQWSKNGTGRSPSRLGWLIRARWAPAASLALSHRMVAGSRYECSHREFAAIDGRSPYPLGSLPAWMSWRPGLPLADRPRKVLTRGVCCQRDGVCPSRPGWRCSHGWRLRPSPSSSSSSRGINFRFLS
jgi:hypothetical protein